MLTRKGSPWSGSDLGITSLAVLSTGEVIGNPRHLEIAQREPGAAPTCRRWRSFGKAGSVVARCLDGRAALVWPGRIF
jgi:hypothetical protein